MRAIFHDHIYVGLCLVDIVTSYDVIVFEIAVNFYLSFE